jgi:SAM-dependent methyltransferase
MPPYQLMYKVGLAPWERRDVGETWARIMASLGDPAPGRALDIGCGTGRDAVYLAKRGWRVTAVDFVDEALKKARRRAAEEGVEVEWLQGDVSHLDRLGLEPGYNLLYDFGCIQGLPDAARQGAVSGLSQLAAPGASLVMFAFMAGRRFFLPRGMDESDVVALVGGGWDLEHTQSVATDDMPALLRRAQPTIYRLSRRDGTKSPA